MEFITPPALLLIYSIFLLLVVLTFTIALVSVLKNQFYGNEKLIWLLVVILVPIFGPILYLSIGRKSRIPK